LLIIVIILLLADGVRVTDAPLCRSVIGWEGAIEQRLYSLTRMSSTAIPSTSASAALRSAPCHTSAVEPQLNALRIDIRLWLGVAHYVY
jgi:hypothetical protein